MCQAIAVNKADQVFDLVEREANCQQTHKEINMVSDCGNSL